MYFSILMHARNTFLHLCMMLLDMFFCIFFFYLFWILLKCLNRCQTERQRVRQTDNRSNLPLPIRAEWPQPVPKPWPHNHIWARSRAQTNQASPLTDRPVCGRFRWRVALSFPQNRGEHPRGRWHHVCSGARNWLRILALSSALCMEDYSKVQHQ